MKKTRSKTVQDRDDQFIIDSVNMMMEIAGHPQRFEDLVKEKDGWYTRYTMTKEQEERFKKWFIAHSKKVLRRGKKWSETTYGYFSLMWGLRIQE